MAASRALSPVEIAICNWKGFMAARQSYERLCTALASLPQKVEPLQLPAPKKELKVENVWVDIPGSPRVVLSQIDFSLKAGQALAVIGPSASGKSSLARTLVGVWQVGRGAVRLDGAALAQWRADDIGSHVGYLPQDVELFEGTITENIARFEEEPDSKAILRAANAAGVHDMVLRLPNGYETQIGPHGTALSAGQRTARRARPGALPRAFPW